METLETLRPPGVGGGSPTQATPPWPRFLRWWALAGGLAMTALFATAGPLQSATASNPLWKKYPDLAAALAHPAWFRVSFALDIAVWLALGGMFLAFGALFRERAGVRATLLTACGIGQVIGTIGGFIRLEGITRVADSYTTALPADRPGLLRSAFDLQTLAGLHYSVGSILWTTALLLVASLVWRSPRFPRWVAVLMVVAAVCNFATDVTDAVTNKDVLSFFGQVPLFCLLGVFFGVSRALHRVPEEEWAPRA